MLGVPHRADRDYAGVFMNSSEDSVLNHTNTVMSSWDASMKFRKGNAENCTLAFGNNSEDFKAKSDSSLLHLVRPRAPVGFGEFLHRVRPCMQVGVDEFLHIVRLRIDHKVRGPIGHCTLAHWRSTRHMCRQTCQQTFA